MGDRFPLPVNTGRVDWRAFSLAELTGRQHGPSTRLVETGLKLQERVYRSRNLSTSVTTYDVVMALERHNGPRRLRDHDDD